MPSGAGDAGAVLRLSPWVTACCHASCDCGFGERRMRSVCGFWGRSLTRSLLSINVAERYGGSTDLSAGVTMTERPPRASRSSGVAPHLPLQGCGLPAVSVGRAGRCGFATYRLNRVETGPGRWRWAAGAVVPLAGVAWITLGVVTLCVFRGAGRLYRAERAAISTRCSRFGRRVTHRLSVPAEGGTSPSARRRRRAGAAHRGRTCGAARIAGAQAGRASRSAMLLAPAGSVILGARGWSALRHQDLPKRTAHGTAAAVPDPPTANL